MGQPLAHERGGVPGEPGGSPRESASERRGLAGETWFPPRERGPLQRPRAKPEDAQGKAGGERGSCGEPSEPAAHRCTWTAGGPSAVGNPLARRCVLARLDGMMSVFSGLVCGGGSAMRRLIVVAG